MFTPTTLEEAEGLAWLLDAQGYFICCWRWPSSSWPLMLALSRN